jgi:transcriptional regulator with XRE-family HTH domain
MNLRSVRKAAGVSQFFVAQESGVARMRLSLAETGQLTLRPEEQNAIVVVLRRALNGKSAELKELLLSTSYSKS